MTAASIENVAREIFSAWLCEGATISSLTRYRLTPADETFAALSLDLKWHFEGYQKTMEDVQFGVRRLACGPVS